MTGLAPDAGVPQRDALLEPDTVARLLAAAGAQVHGCERTYAKYRVGESLRVVHRVEAAGGHHHVAARSFRDGESEPAYRRALAAAVPAGPLNPVLHAPELDAVFWTFPNDRRLTALPLLTDRSAALARHLGGPCRTRVVAYAAERSASAQCLDEQGRVLAFAKVHAGDGAARERAGLAAAGAAADTHLRVPRMLAAIGDRGVVLEALAGRRLDTLPAAARADATWRLGSALAVLHTRAPVPAVRFGRLDPERLARAVAVLARARPDAGESSALLLAALLARPDHAAGPAVCLHGDANPRNALIDGDRVALVDLEDAAAGPAAADLGQLLAGLLAARVQGNIGAARERALGGALLAGYAAVARPPARDSLRWHTAAAVLARTALPAVNRLRPALLTRLGPLLDAAKGLPA